MGSRSTSGRAGAGPAGSALTSALSEVTEGTDGARGVDEVDDESEPDLGGVAEGGAGGASARRTSAPGPNLIRMSEFARESGVPIPTIKHYLREGLLPEPVRTSRNMAYYDRALIPRVRAIKDLQRTQFLPLKVIREILDGIGVETSVEDAAVQASIQRVLAASSPDESRSRTHLIEAGLPPEELDLMTSLGIVSPDYDEAGEAHFHGDDLALLRTLGHARRAGLSAEMLPANVLATYFEHIHGLVRAELQIFRAGVLPRAGERLEALSEAATTLSERLVVLLRRKLLVPVLEEIVREERARSSR
jgi:DNA-binding transcriptional MerR regulator